MKTLIPLTLILAACGGMRTVPPEALASVPTSQIDSLGALQEAVYDAETSLKRAERKVDDLAAQSKAAQKAAKEASVSVEDATSARATAVGLNDSQRAEELARDLDATKERSADRNSTAARMETQLVIAEETVDAYEAEIEWRKAELELARAEAAVQGGADLKLKKFERQAEKTRENHAEAVAEIDEIEDETGVSL